MTSCIQKTPLIVKLLIALNILFSILLLYMGSSDLWDDYYHGRTGIILNFCGVLGISIAILGLASGYFLYYIFQGQNRQKLIAFIEDLKKNWRKT